MIRKESHSVVSRHRNSSGKAHVNGWVDGKIVFYTEEISLILFCREGRSLRFLKVSGKLSNIYLPVPVIQIKLGNFLGLSY